MLTDLGYSKDSFDVVFLIDGTGAFSESGRDRNINNVIVSLAKNHVAVIGVKETGSAAGPSPDEWIVPVGETVSANLLASFQDQLSRILREANCPEIQTISGHVYQVVAKALEDYSSFGDISDAKPAYIETADFDSDGIPDRRIGSP